MKHKYIPYNARSVLPAVRLNQNILAIESHCVWLCVGWGRVMFWNYSSKSRFTASKTYIFESNANKKRMFGIILENQCKINISKLLRCQRHLIEIWDSRCLVFFAFFGKPNVIRPVCKRSAFHNASYRLWFVENPGLFLHPICNIYANFRVSCPIYQGFVITMILQTRSAQAR